MFRGKLAGGLRAVLVGFSLVAILIAPASAATSSTNAGDGLKVSPVISNIVITPGHTQVVTVYVQNVTNSTITLQAVVNDFIAANNESGQPALLLDPNQYAPSHSLKRYVSPIGSFSLKAGEQKSVNVSITIPENAPGGGYYGAVRFAPVSASGTSSVTLSASVGSLILVRVPGTFKEDLQLLSIDARTSTNDNPQVVFFGGSKIVAAVRFQNSGDVQEQPFGKVLLMQNGKQLASYEINNTTPRGNVLPDSTRKFTVTLDKVGAFGQYTVSGNFGYGSNGQLLSGQTTFYVIPLALIIVVLLVVAIVLFMIFGFPKLMRRYNESVIRRASRR